MKNKATILLSVLLASVMFAVLLTGCVSTPQDDGGIVPRAMRDNYFFYDRDQRTYNEDLILFGMAADGTLTRTKADLAGAVEIRDVRVVFGEDTTQRYVEVKAQNNNPGGEIITAQITSVTETGRSRTSNRETLITYDVVYVLNDKQYTVVMRSEPATGNLSLINADPADPLFYPMLSFYRELWDNPERTISLRPGRRMVNPLEGVWFPSQETANDRGMPDIKQTADNTTGYSFYILSGEMYNQFKQKRGPITFNYREKTMFVGTASASASWSINGTALTITNSRITGLTDGVYYQATDEAAAANIESHNSPVNRLLRNLF